MTDLELKFHQEMVSIYKAAKKECGYNAIRFLQLITDKGGVEAARQLIIKQTSGFSALVEFNRLDLSVEACILKPEYALLFTESERDICRERLRNLGYKY